MHEGGRMILKLTQSGFLLCAHIFLLIIPAIYTKPGLNNAGYIPNGLLV
jgi:hypothetical protein